MLTLAQALEIVALSEEEYMQARRKPFGAVSFPGRAGLFVYQCDIDDYLAMGRWVVRPPKNSPAARRRRVAAIVKDIRRYERNEVERFRERRQA